MSNDIEAETNQWIKSIFQLSFRNGQGLLEYGNNICDPSTTNIFKKPLSPGEFFSVKYAYADEEENEAILVVRTITDYGHA